MQETAETAPGYCRQPRPADNHTFGVASSFYVWQKRRCAKRGSLSRHEPSKDQSHSSWAIDVPSVVFSKETVDYATIVSTKFLRSFSTLWKNWVTVRGRISSQWSCFAFWLYLLSFSSSFCGWGNRLFVSDEGISRLAVLCAIGIGGGALPQQETAIISHE